MVTKNTPAMLQRRTRRSLVVYIALIHSHNRAGVHVDRQVVVIVQQEVGLDAAYGTAELRWSGKGALAIPPTNRPRQQPMPLQSSRSESARPS
jgi:hypothetical protein